MLQGEFGKYRIENVIGMGGMSIVYRAFDQSLQREAALKILNVRRMANPVEVRRFQREVEVAQRLRHPNIIDIYEYGEVENFAYLAMELMPGGSLAERYANPIHLTLGESVELLSVIASALDFAHAEGVLHRDLKLSNILIAADGRLTLSDFGLALMQDESRITRTGQTFGTPIYMSPEQVNGVRGIDYRADVYSFAVIAYLLATGYFPFMSSNTLMILNQHLSDRAPLPSKLNPRLPETLDDVLLKGLSKKPQDRHTSAGALARAFAEAVAGIEDTEIVLLTSQPTPIIEPSSHYGFKPGMAQKGDATAPVRDWQGEITPDLSELDDALVTGAMAKAAPTGMERVTPEVGRQPRFSRWAIGISLVVATFAVLMALGAILPTARSASLSEGLDVEGTRAPTSTLLPSATFSMVTFGEATPTLPVFVGLSTAIAGNGNAVMQANMPVETGDAELVEFVEPSATATVTETIAPTMTRTAVPTSTVTATERRATPSRTPVPETTTPTATPTWHEVYVMATSQPTSARGARANQTANNSAVQPTAAPQTQAENQPQAQATSAPATRTSQPTGVPPTAVPATQAPQTGLLGALLNPLLAPVGSLLPVVPTVVSALP